MTQISVKLHFVSKEVRILGQLGYMESLEFPSPCFQASLAQIVPEDNDSKPSKPFIYFKKYIYLFGFFVYFGCAGS